MQTRHTGLGLPKETPVLVCLVFDEKGVHQLLINPIWNLVCVLEDDVLYLTLASAYTILSTRKAVCRLRRPLLRLFGHCLQELAHEDAQREEHPRQSQRLEHPPHVLDGRATVTRRHGSQRGIGPGPRRGNRRLWRWRHRTVLL